MNQAVGDGIVVVKLILAFAVLVLYFLNPNTKSDLIILSITVATGLILLLSAALVGMVMKEANFGTY